jgi:Protein of unknown function (DUF3619)
MTSRQQTTERLATLEAQFGAEVAARLSADVLSPNISERLRIARSLALTRRKLAPETPALLFTAGAVAPVPDDRSVQVKAAVLLVALVGGLIAIHFVQDNNHAEALADIDSALLTDDLPPAAFTDSGFTQYLKSAAGVDR